MYEKLRKNLITMDHLPRLAEEMFTKDPKEAWANANLTMTDSAACQGTVWSKSSEYANKVCDEIAAQVNLLRDGDVKNQARVPGGCTTKHDDGKSDTTSRFTAKSDANDLRMVVSVNTLMELHTDACVFWWETPKDTVQAHILPCHVLQNFLHQASSPRHPGCSWVCNLKAL
jgi:hypothetical protein